MPLTGLLAAVPSEVDRERQRFVETVEEILPERDELVGEFNNLVEMWNDHWGWFHRNLWNREDFNEERDVLERIRRNLEETPFPEETGGGSILDLADRVVNHHTPVVSLFLTSMRWVDDTMTPTSEVYNRIWSVADGRDLAQWDGEARTAYNDIVAQQQQSTEAAKDLASFMSAWLSNIADDNVGYVTDLLDRLADLAGIIAAGIAALADSFGVFTLQKIAELVGEVVQQAISHLGEIARRISAAVDRIIDAERALGDHSYFPGGKWPLAVDRA